MYKEKMVSSTHKEKMVSWIVKQLDSIGGGLLVVALFGFATDVEPAAIWFGAITGVILVAISLALTVPSAKQKNSK